MNTQKRNIRSNMEYIDKWKSAFAENKTTALIIAVIASGIIAPIVGVIAKKGINYLSKKYKR